MEFEKLIQRCIDRDERALHELYKYCFQTLMRVTKRYFSGNDDAVSGMNQAFLKVVNNLSTFRIDENFEAWIKRIAVNTCIDEYRKNKRYRAHVAMSEEQSVTVLELNGRVHNEAMHKLNVDAIFLLINELPDTTRQVFNLSAIDGYNHKEIGTMLNITEVTSRWHLHKARTTLQNKIQEMDNKKKLSYELHRG